MYNYCRRIVENFVIVPLVVTALAISKLLKAVFSILIYVLDYAFPILLQLMRIPLLAARLLGDGIELFLEGVVQCLPSSTGDVMAITKMHFVVALSPFENPKSS